MVTGERGSLRWGYRPVASVLAWSLHARTLSGRVTDVDTYGISQRPLVFVATTERKVWRFSVLELQIADGHLTARLSSQET